MPVLLIFKESLIVHFSNIEFCFVNNEEGSLAFGGELVTEALHFLYFDLIVVHAAASRK